MRIDRTGWKYRSREAHTYGVITIIGYCPNMKKWVGSCEDWCMILSEIEYDEMRRWERIK